MGVSKAIFIKLLRPPVGINVLRVNKISNGQKSTFDQKSAQISLCPILSQTHFWAKKRPSPIFSQNLAKSKFCRQIIAKPTVAPISARVCAKGHLGTKFLLLWYFTDNRTQSLRKYPNFLKCQYNCFYYNSVFRLTLF